MHGDVDQVREIKVSPKYKYVNPFRWITLLTACVGLTVASAVHSCCAFMPRDQQLVIPPEKAIEASNHAIRMVEAAKAWDTNNERLMDRAIADAVKLYGQPATADCKCKNCSK